MTPWVRRLLFVNVGMYFTQMLSPAVEDWLVFVPGLALARPWTIVTYMFLHGSPTHLLFNMLGLFFFGPRIEGRLGPDRFVQLYFISGMVGAFLSFLLARNHGILGASGAIFGIMFAFARYWPTATIMIWGIIPVQARWLVIITTILALQSGFSGSQGGVADFAHLGGYLGAWLFLRYIERNPSLKRFQAKATAGPPPQTLSNWKRVDTSRVHEANRDEVNRILDKIQKEGLGSLTPQERLFISNFVPPDDRTPAPS